jgi:hypothetical protein
MRRLLCGLVATGALLIQQQAFAQPQCATTTDETAFEVEALKSEMMVLATGCHDDDQYNAFIRRYQADLQRSEHEIDAYFKRTYGAHAQQQHDAYITSLANAQSDQGLTQGTDFCPRNAALFTEAMSLQNPEELPAYVAGKDLVPASLGTCSAPPVHTVATRGRGHVTHASPKKHTKS